MFSQAANTKECTFKSPCDCYQFTWSWCNCCTNKQTSAFGANLVSHHMYVVLVHISSLKWLQLDTDCKAKQLAPKLLQRNETQSASRPSRLVPKLKPWMWLQFSGPFTCKAKQLAPKLLQRNETKSQQAKRWCPSCCREMRPSLYHVHHDWRPSTNLECGFNCHDRHDHPPKYQL